MLYGVEGAVPRPLAARVANDWWFSLHTAVQSDQMLHALFCVHTLCAVLLVGLCCSSPQRLHWPRRALFGVVWALTCSIHARNSFVCYGSDQLLLAMLFWNAFAPHRTLLPLRVLASLMYGTSAVRKLLGNSWFIGATALQETAQLAYFARPLAAQWASVLPAATLALLTRAVLLFELLGWCLLWLPARRAWTLFACAALAMHGAFWAALDVGSFAPTCMALVVVFLRTEPRSHSTMRTTALAALCSAAVAWVALADTPLVQRYVHTPPTALINTIDALHLRQEWSMFAPDPPRQSHFHVLWATTNDGRRIELLDNNHSRKNSLILYLIA